MKLTAENVHTVLMDCLFTPEEVARSGGHPKMVTAQAVQLHIGLHPDRLESHRSDIEAMADQLLPEFKKDIGGGSSFLNACVTADGHQWGEHQNIDELLVLGTAIGKMAILMPNDRELWQSLPGGMPYIVVN